MKKYILVTGCFWMLTLALAATAQVKDYYVSASSGSDSNDGSQARPWATWAKANASATLGTNGTTVHFADGTYVASTSNSCGSLGPASFCITHGGNASQPLIFQCDNGLDGNAGHPGSPGHCLIRESSDAANPQIMGTVNANYTTIQGFDIGGDSGHPATLAQSAVLMYAKDGTANFNQVNYNYVHDVAKRANDGNGFGNGCPSEGMVGVDYGFDATAGRIPQGLKFIGNFLNNMGDITNVNCNQTHGLYIGAGPNVVVQNNISGNAPGSGIKLYASNCQSVVTNNLTFHTGWWGILVQSSGETRNDGCLGLGIAPGKSTINNNIVVNSGYNHACGGIAETAGAGANLFANNLLIGNPTNVPVVNCTSTPVAGNSPSTVTGTLNTANSGATTANTMVNYQDNGFGDYHLKAGSAAVGAGTTSCVSGGLSPCAPTKFLAGLTRPTPISIGFDELGTNASQPPDSPTNLTAIVQ